MKTSGKGQQAGRFVPSTGGRTLHVPTPMLRDMQKQATRFDRNVSWCIRMAWDMASRQIGDCRQEDRPLRSPLLRGRKRPLAVKLPATTWQNLVDEGARLDRSQSWLVQQAWLAARPHFP
jgi:hypothetical protein